MRNWTKTYVACNLSIGTWEIFIQVVAALIQSKD